MTAESEPPQNPRSPQVYQLIQSARARVSNLGGPTIEATSLILRISNLDLVFEEDPQEELMYINAICEVTEPIIHKYNGVISDMFSMDSTRAFFGVYPEQADPVLQAVTTALELRKALADFQEIKWQVRFGIGVNH